MRVAIADDSVLFRRGLAALLRTAGIEVTVEAQDGDELLASVQTDPPDAAIVDIRMPPTFTDEGLSTAAALAEIQPGIGILVLSTYAETDYAARLLELDGVGVGYLIKDRVDDIATLTDALHRVIHHESVIDPEIVSRLFARNRNSSALESLTPREEAVIRHMAEGRSNSGIAEQLHLSAKTVEAHVAAIFTKLDLYPQSSTNRRILAVLEWLRAAQTDSQRFGPENP